MQRVLYVGEVAAGTTCGMRAAALSSLGYLVTTISVLAANRPPPAALLWRKICNRLRRPVDATGVNRRIVETARNYDFLWIDKGNVITRDTLAAVQKGSPRPVIIGYSPDDMEQRHCTSAWFHSTLPLYDAFITTKSFNVPELTRRACRRVIFTDNAYDPATHRPVVISEQMRQEHAGSVGFIGYHEEARERSMSRLAAAGVEVHVYGPGWTKARRRMPPQVRLHPSVFGDDYAATISALPISLGFLRKCNRDLQTTRSVEIPACGGFLLAERTVEHQRLFHEGLEAEYFADDDELLKKVVFYLSHPSERLAVAARGRARCIAGRYAYADRLHDALQLLGYR
jgi:spore maturation protein CgeB